MEQQVSFVSDYEHKLETYHLPKYDIINITIGEITAVVDDSITMTLDLTDAKVVLGKKGQPEMVRGIDLTYGLRINISYGSRLQWSLNNHIINILSLKIPDTRIVDTKGACCPTVLSDPSVSKEEFIKILYNIVWE